MTIQLPEDLEHYVQNQVQTGRFASADEAIATAVRLLRQRTDEPAAPGKPLSEDEWQQRLMEVGLLTNIPPTRTGSAARREFQPVRIKGEPLSETVIHERR